MFRWALNQTYFKLVIIFGLVLTIVTVTRLMVTLAVRLITVIILFVPLFPTVVMRLVRVIAPPSFRQTSGNGADGHSPTYFQWWTVFLVRLGGLIIIMSVLFSLLTPLILPFRTLVVGPFIVLWVSVFGRYFLIKIVRVRPFSLIGRLVTVLFRRVVPAMSERVQWQMIPLFRWVTSRRGVTLFMTLFRPIRVGRRTPLIIRGRPLIPFKVPFRLTRVLRRGTC